MAHTGGTGAKLSISPSPREVVTHALSARLTEGGVAFVAIASGKVGMFSVVTLLQKNMDRKSARDLNVLVVQNGFRSLVH